jgi:hypothetical protein
VVSDREGCYSQVSRSRLGKGAGVKGGWGGEFICSTQACGAPQRRAAAARAGLGEGAGTQGAEGEGRGGGVRGGEGSQ